MALFGQMGRRAGAVAGMEPSRFAAPGVDGLDPLAQARQRIFQQAKLQGMSDEQAIAVAMESAGGAAPPSDRIGQLAETVANARDFPSGGYPEPVPQPMQQPVGDDPHAAHAGDSIEDHYAFHGRDREGILPRKKRSTGAKILRALGHGFQNLAAANGNPVALAKVRKRLERREDREKAESDFAAHDRLVRLMMQRRGDDPGMSLADAEFAALNPGKFSEEFNTRFRSREVSKGEGIYTPGFGGGGRFTVGPDTFQHQADVQQTGPQTFSVPASGIPQPQTKNIKLRTADEQFADNIGPRDSEAWMEAYKDSGLGAHGPTAYKMHSEDRATTERGQDITRENNIRTNDTSRANNVRSTDTSRQNNERTTSTTRRGQDITDKRTRESAGFKGRGRGSGRMRARNAAGQVVEWNGSAWVQVQ